MHELILSLVLLFNGVIDVLVPKDDLDAFKACLEASDGSDSACETCEYFYNPSGNFDLSQEN